MKLFELARDQHGLFTTPQARSLGHNKQALAVFFGNGVIERLAPSVYGVTAVPRSWRRDVMVAVLSIPGSLASHRTAAALWGLDGFSPGVVELVTERWTRRPRPFGTTVHESKDLAAGDVDERDCIPCTSLVRTLVDLPAIAPEFRCGQALDGAIRYDRAVLKGVRQRHIEVARRGRNGTVALRTLLVERGEGDRVVDSGFERRALRLIDDSNLPRPKRQWCVRDGDFVCYLDLAWPEQFVAMECDSYRFHMGEAAFRWERRRRRHLHRLGWTVLEFTYDEVVKSGPRVLRELSHHLGGRRHHETA